MTKLAPSANDLAQAVHFERDKRIAEAAFYRAEKRGFIPGFALEDWLAAEALVDFEIKAARARHE